MFTSGSFFLDDDGAFIYRDHDDSIILKYVADEKKKTLASTTNKASLFEC
jgi:hypothetical protein